ncbi:MAG: SDR family NAD(P)-dependent oxidoreductase [Oscillospiraceae bacterium]|jgi:NAD(P)-dependent dehydrogenase (short-subunit alcohol dehydrogenase family)|nr:SDR family NAD(P)-dependent oxidoreductase [Oscillospiraceae bacterium]
MKYPYGTNVFLTGGSSGIGLATSELLAADGYTVYAASRNPPDETRIYSGGGEIRPVKLNVRDPQSIESAVMSIGADIGIIVHCAGIGIACAGEDYPHDAVSALLETNFCGVLRVNSHLLPHLRKRGGGLCVIVGSVAGVFPIPFQSHYSASKAALDSYSAALRMELRAYGIRVCLLMPGDANTGFTGARKYEISETSTYYDACLRAVKKMEKDELGGYPPVTVARVVSKLCGRKNVPSRKVVGFSYKLLVFLRRFLPVKLIEFILRAIYMGK